MIKRSSVILVSIALLGGTLQPTLAAGPVNGGSCAKAGSVQGAVGHRFVCTKVGKKLLWRATPVKPLAPMAAPTPAATPAPAATSTPTPAPSSSPSPSATPTVAKVMTKIPLSLPVPQNGTIPFANAIDHISEIPTVAWKRVQDTIAANSLESIPTTIDIGPNTKADKDLITAAVNREYTLFAGFQHFPTYGMLVSNAADEKWAEAQAPQTFSKMGIKGAFTRQDVINRILQGNCEMNGTTAVNCSGGMAVDFRDGGSSDGFSFLSVETGAGDFWTSANRNAGPMTQVDHELTHNYQFAQFINKPLLPGQNTKADQSHAFTPWWVSEAQANGIGIAVFIDNVQDYVNVRNSTVTRYPGSRAKLPAFTAAGLKSFLSDSQETGPQNSNWPMAYTIGYAAMEALIAIGGPQSTLALYALGGNGETWEEAFQHVFGISWDEGSTILGQILAAEYASKPMRQS